MSKKFIINFFFVLLLNIGMVMLVMSQWTASLEVGLSRYYNLDETTGNATDLASTHKNYTLVEPAGYELKRGVPGVQGTAYNFTAALNGATGSYLNATSPDSSCYDLNCTIAVWVNFTQAGNRYIYVQGNNSLSRAYLAIFTDTDKVTARLVNNTGQTLDAAGTAGINNGMWNLIVVKLNVTHLSIYTNGTLSSKVAFTGAGLTVHRRIEHVNARPGDQQDIGQTNMDELGIWNRSLTDTEIAQLYNGGDGTTFGQAQAQEIFVSLNSPADGERTSNANQSFLATSTPINVTLTNATLYLWNSSFGVVNRTTKINVGILDNSTQFNITDIPFGLYEWNVFGCSNNDSGKAFCAFAPSNRSFGRQQFDTGDTEYDLQVYETMNQTFRVNITVDSSATLFAGTFVYNGTPHVAEKVSLGGGLYQLVKYLDIPTVNANTTKSFYWTITLDSGTGFNIQNTSVSLQNVSQTNITEQNIGTSSINYTVYDEETLVKLDSFTYDITNSWYLGNGSSRDNSSAAKPAPGNFLFYTYPRFKTFYSDVTLRINNGSNATNNVYEDRQFDFVKQRLEANTLSEQPLYLLRDGNGTNVVLELKDTGLAPLPDYLVKVYRYYPSTNSHLMVESKKTDLFGQVTTKLVENSVRYKIEFYNSANALVKTVDNVYVVCRNNACSQQFIIGSSANYFDQFNNLTDYQYTFSFNNNTNIFTFVWQDDRGQSASHYLQVKRRLFNGTTDVCNATTSSSSNSADILTCSVGSSKASYEAQAFRVVAGETRRIGVMNVKVGDLSQTFGKEGLIWSLVLLGTMILIGSYNPPIGVTLYLLGRFILGITDIYYINPAIMVAEIVVGVLFIWAFRN